VSAARRHHAATPWAFLMPALLILGVFVGLAFIQVVYASFTRSTAFREPEWVGIANYRRLYSSPVFWNALANSALYLIVTPLLVIMSLWAAITVHASLRGTRWLRLILFLPVVTPTIVAALAWRIVLHNEGVLNALLAAVGIAGPNWLTTHPFSLMSAMLVTLWKGFGFYMMIFLAGLLAVPRELEEAAELDGASRWQRFRHVTLPAIRPLIALVLVVSSVAALKVFDELYVTVKGVPLEQQTVVPLVFHYASEVGDYGMACAIGLTLFVFVLGFSLLNLRLSASRAQGGAA
jgi:putative chitobiose transport system permease protein